MDYTYDDLKHKTVAELREIAKDIEHDAVKGYTQLNKEHLLKALCEAIGIDMHVHHEVVGVDKRRLKAKIRKLKKMKEEALASQNRTEAQNLRKRIRRLKKKIRRAMV